MSCNRYTLIQEKDRIIHSDARLLYLSTAKYGGDWHSLPHTHDFTELFFVIGGSGQVSIENELYPVHVGDLFVINPNVEHTETSLNAQPLEYIVLGVENLQLSLQNEDDDRFCVVHFQNHMEDILFYLHTMQREIEAKPVGYEMVCQDFLDILVIQLMRQTKFSAALVPLNRRSSHICALVRRYIDNHYKEEITLEHLAQIAHVSKYHVVHIFSKEYGISPISYLAMRRIEESRQLLITTDFSLSYIAHTLGFSSSSYFSQAFRKLEGVSPTEYRRTHKQQRTEQR